MNFRSTNNVYESNTLHMKSGVAQIRIEYTCQ